MDTGHIQHHIQLALPYTIVQLQQIKASCRIPVFLRKCWSNSANKVLHLFSKCAELLKRSERFRLMFCFDEVAQPDPFSRLDCLKESSRDYTKKQLPFVHIYSGVFGVPQTKLMEDSDKTYEPL